MSANPIDSNSTDKPTGSLEDLFRHHLAEASVPPRPMLWDQIDNSLLLRQNETYRRRLAATRWVAAASLLLASLAGTGWWTLRDAVRTGSVATSTRPAADAETNRSERNPGAYAQATEAAPAAAAAGEAPRPQSRTRANSPVVAAADKSFLKSAATSNAASRRASQRLTDPSAAGSFARNTSAVGSSAAIETGSGTPLGTSAGALSADGAGNASASGTALEGAPQTGTNQLAQSVAEASTDAAARSVGLAAGAPGVTGAASELGLLATRRAGLASAAPAALPTGLSALEQAAVATADPAKRWSFGASYATGVFQPNINFSRRGADSRHGYNTSAAFGENTVALSETAAAQYRDHVEGGLTQRITARAIGRLATRWSLATGLEISQSRATSATSLGYTGEQVVDLGQNPYGALRTTTFRYRSAGIPVEVRYATPEKKGWSAYGRVGAAVSALLSTRTEVDGIPEATRTYSIGSSNTPYRRVLANVRGGVGAQYRPVAGSWALSVGPVAETGLLSLNANPAQDFLSQSRAYSFGLEAGVEFGRR